MQLFKHSLICIINKRRKGIVPGKKNPLFYKSFYLGVIAESSVPNCQGLHIMPVNPIL